MYEDTYVAAFQHIAQNCLTHLISYNLIDLIGKSGWLVIVSQSLYRDLHSQLLTAAYGS